MLPGPVFNVELVALARRARYYVFRFLYGLILLFLVWINDPARYRYDGQPEVQSMTIQEMSQLGRTIFYSFVVTQSLAILILTPTLVAGVIADERQRKTLHYLLASCLSSGEIVVGKLAARLLFTAVFLTLGMPIVVMLSLFGGVDPNEALLFFAGSASTMFFLGAVAITASTHTPRPREAVSLTYIVELVWLFVPPVAMMTATAAGGKWAQAYEWIRPVNEWVGASNPLFVLMKSGPMGSAATMMAGFLWMIGLQLAYGAALVVFAVLRLRPIFRSQGVSEGKVARAVRRRNFRLLRRRPCGDDPVLWKECHVSRMTPSVQAAAMIILLSVAGLMVYFAYDFLQPAVQELFAFGYGGPGNNSARDQYNGFVRAVLTLFYICLALGVASAASNALTSEREQDTWISLLATPLTASEIVRGKLVGALWSMRWIATVWLLFALSGLLVGAIHPVGFAAGVGLTAIYVAFAAALGTAYSLRARTSSRALTATVGTLLVLNGLYLMACIPFSTGPGNGMIFAGVTPAWEASSWMTYEEFRNVIIGNYARNVQDEGGALVAGFLSALIYGVGAAVLITMTIARFDAVVDRPGTADETPSPERPSPDDREELFALTQVEKSPTATDPAENGEPSVAHGSGEDQEPAR